MRRNKLGWSVALWVGCILAVGAMAESAWADLLVHEPFAYADGILTGRSGALGTTGPWASHEFVNGDWRVHQEGDTSDVGLSGSNNANDPLGFNAFDGTVDNLATSGGYVGLWGAEDWGDPDPHSGEPGRHMDAHIALDPFVTASFTSDATTWFSFVSVRGWDRNEESPQLMIGTDPSPDNARGFHWPAAAVGKHGIGGGGGPTRGNYGDVFPSYLQDGTSHTTPGGYLGGVLGGHDGVQDVLASQGTADGVLEGGVQTMIWVDNDDNGDFGAPNIVVGKIEWDADTGEEDIISVVRFLETDTLSEDAFDARIIAQPPLSSANWPSNKPNLDQRLFDTLNFSGTKFFVDEIRLATTFADAVPSVGTRPLGDVNNDGDVDRVDAALLVGQLGVGPESDFPEDNKPDVDGDTFVTLSDLEIVRTNLQTSGVPAASQAAVPEPATLALVVLGLIGYAMRCRPHALDTNPQD